MMLSAHCWRSCVRRARRCATSSGSRASRRSRRSNKEQISVLESDEIEDQMQGTSSPAVVINASAEAKSFSNDATPSPAQSDKENLPSSAAYNKSHPILSPPTTRVALAPATPTRHAPNKFLSPSKHKMLTTSSGPGEPVDLDALLLASPQATPGSLAVQLAHAAGGLSEEERGMSVEEWVRWRAEKEAEELRRKCEALVLGFEKQGVRGLECLRGIRTTG